MGDWGYLIYIAYEYQIHLSGPELQYKIDLNNSENVVLFLSIETIYVHGSQDV